MQAELRNAWAVASAQWLRVGLAAGLLVAAPPAEACSMFSVAFGDHAYMANNEDYVEPGFVWFVPGDKKRHGRVNFGFADRFVQGGMNDQGLSFDAAVVPEVPYRGDDDKTTPRNLPNKIMDECATVDEAIEYFRRYNCPHLSRTQFLFADRTGASAVIAGLPGTGLSVTRKDGPYQLITNDRLEPSSYRCERFVLGTRELRDPAAYDLDRVRAALARMHARGEQAFTSYSNIYDLTGGTVTVYNLADFGRSVTYDLARELARGEHSYELARVFEDAGALAAIRAADRPAYDTEVPLDPDALERLVGTYRTNEGAAKLRVELREGALLLVMPEGRNAHLYPEEPTLFRVREGGQIRFDIAADGTVRGLSLYRGRDLYAERIDEPAPSSAPKSD